jgi:hypothetical protein
VTITFVIKEHIFLNDRRGGFRDATARLWPDSENLGLDDNMDVFLDFDSDGDADLLIGSLDDPDRLLMNNGTGKVKLVNRTQSILNDTPGMLAIAVAPHDWRSVVLRWRTDGQTHQTPMQWYGEYLWRGTIDEPPTGDFSYKVCATDAAGK